MRRVPVSPSPKALNLSNLHVLGICYILRHIGRGNIGARAIGVLSRSSVVRFILISRLEYRCEFYQLSRFETSFEGRL
jgi:hypothetical protein